MVVVVVTGAGVGLGRGWGRGRSNSGRRGPTWLSRFSWAKVFRCRQWGATTEWRPCVQYRFFAVTTVALQGQLTVRKNLPKDAPQNGILLRAPLSEVNHSELKPVLVLKTHTK